MFLCLLLLLQSIDVLLPLTVSCLHFTQKATLLSYIELLYLTKGCSLVLGATVALWLTQCHWYEVLTMCGLWLISLCDNKVYQSNWIMSDSNFLLLLFQKFSLHFYGMTCVTNHATSSSSKKAPLKNLERYFISTEYNIKQSQLSSPLHPPFIASAPVVKDTHISGRQGRPHPSEGYG